MATGTRRRAERSSDLAWSIVIGLPAVVTLTAGPAAAHTFPWAWPVTLGRHELKVIAVDECENARSSATQDVLVVGQAVATPSLP